MHRGPDTTNLTSETPTNDSRTSPSPVRPDRATTRSECHLFAHPSPSSPLTSLPLSFPPGKDLFALRNPSSAGRDFRPVVGLGRFLPPTHERRRGDLTRGRTVTRRVWRRESVSLTQIWVNSVRGRYGSLWRRRTTQCSGPTPPTVDNHRNSVRLTNTRGFKSTPSGLGVPPT